MKKQWTIILGILALLLAPVGWAMAADPCPDTGGTEFIVDTAADAEEVDDGYDNAACKLIIKTNIETDAGVRNMRWEAKSIKVEGPVDIINNNFDGAITLIADNGDIDIDKGKFVADDTIKFECLSPATCKITVKDSHLEANRHITINSQSDGLVQDTTVLGGEIDFRSANGSFTWHCPLVGGCQDPTKSSKEKELCGDPPVYPCTVTFANSDELREVCFPGGGECSGDKILVRAFLFVDVEGSKITSKGHFLIISDTADIKAKDSDLSSDTKLILVAATTVDVSNAKLSGKADLRITGGNSSGTCPVPDGLTATDCINAFGAELKSDVDINLTANENTGQVELCDATLQQGANGPPFPRVNGDQVPPYSPFVLDTTAECNANGAKGPATIDGVTN